MNSEIYSYRELDFPIEQVYEAFANPDLLKKWWGPMGFTNTIHEFDLRANGKWILTMHGPDKGNYENSSVFKTVIPYEYISWTRLSPPLFEMEIAFEKMDSTKSKISFKMIFKTQEECQKMEKFVLPKNEENFDRLEQVLLHLH